MSSKVFSAALIGLDGTIAEVEADISAGLGNFIIVGLPDTAVQEAKERVRAAIKNSGFSFPHTRVTVNLAPADIKKEGPAYDLPIALSILLAASGSKQYHSTLPNLQQNFGDITAGQPSSIFIGELSLDGQVRPVSGVLSIALLCRNQGIKTLFLPEANAAEASFIENLEIIPVASLTTLISHLTGQKLIPAFQRQPSDAVAELQFSTEFDMCFIKGQEHAKRALEIAAAGGHNLLMNGPPGSGKTLLARSLPTILPLMELEEAIEVSRIYSVAGLLSPHQPLVGQRPFRSPHHTASGVALVGGGAWPKPGEISLAHRGVLFLDEFPEFSRQVLENLRQPLEDGMITVSRAAGSIQFPAKFTLIASQNPCPCGFATDPEKTCTCSPGQVIKYRKKISGPLLDRIDLHIEVPRLKFEKLTEQKTAEDSATIRKRVQISRNQQAKRFQKLKTCGESNRIIKTNAEMTAPMTKEFCSLDSKSQSLLQQAVNQFHLSARAYFRILKVARTITDLQGETQIAFSHVAEALQYRQQQ